MKKKEKLLVFFCLIMDVLRQIFNRDSMLAGVISRVVYSFAPNDSVVDVLVAKKDTLNSRWRFAF